MRLWLRRFSIQPLLSLTFMDRRSGIFVAVKFSSKNISSIITIISTLKHRVAEKRVKNFDFRFGDTKKTSLFCTRFWEQPFIWKAQLIRGLGHLLIHNERQNKGKYWQQKLGILSCKFASKNKSKIFKNNFGK